MSLASGSQIGPYEILAPIGAGGMGEVYRAKDPRLERVVAIKVLQTPGDPDLLRRFDQEARAVALLNHPNILQVYDTGMVDGTPYIVMEFLEGQSLRDKMAARPLSVRQALDIAIQIARGLTVAHDKKIVHRDLKPENIFVEPDGRVKILDFGLAKLTGPVLAEAPAEDQTLAQRRSAALTQTGVLLGTVGYMSPEQVNGWPTDARSDLFSFGIILHEMLAGRTPFKRTSTVETLHAILKEEVPELDPGLRIPASLERTLHRCLEKDPKHRFQSAQDLVFSLESASLPSSLTLRMGPLRTWRSRTRRLALPVAGLAVALVLGWGCFRLGRVQGGQPPLTYHRLTYRTGLIKGAQFGPDGDTFVYELKHGGPSQLYQGRVGGVGSRPLGLPPDLRILSIGAKGQMALLRTAPGRDSGTLLVAPLSGGAPREVQEAVFGADWGPDGERLAVLREDETGRYALDFPLGHRIYTGPAVSPAVLESPRVSPKGDRIAFLEHLGIGLQRLVVVDLQGRRKDLVSGSCQSLQWAPDGRRILFTFRQPDDRQELRSVDLAGRQMVLDTFQRSVSLHDISPQGRLLLEQAISRSTLAFRGPGDREERDLSWLQGSLLADLSPDGRTVLFGEPYEGTGPGGTYVRPTDGGEAVRLGDGDPLVLSPDGKWALAITMDAERALVLLPRGAGVPRRLGGDLKVDWGQFVDGGRWLLLGATAADGTFALYRQELDGRAPVKWPVEAPADAYCVVSPDGRQIGLAPIKGRIHIHDLTGRLLRQVPGVGPDELLLQWQANGNRVFLGDLSQLPGKIHLLDLDTGARKLFREVAPRDRSGVERLRYATLTPDGARLAFGFRRFLASDLFVTEPLL